MIAFSLGGLIFFGLRFASEPENWSEHALGAIVCLVMLARNTKVIRSNRRIASAPSLQAVLDSATLDEALQSEQAILYKHSTRCPVSAQVIDEVVRFSGAHPDWPVYVLKVVEHRELSDSVADRLGVVHASPQAFVIKNGQCVWQASHYDITTQNLSRHRFDQNPG
jgi:bacillithiol system protein YtxJ